MFGYLGRMILYENPFSNVGAAFQICALSLAPGFFAWTIWLILKQFMLAFGNRFGIGFSDLRLCSWFMAYICIFSTTMHMTGDLMQFFGNPLDEQLLLWGYTLAIATALLQVFCLILLASMTGFYFLQRRRYFRQQSHTPSCNARKFLQDREYEMAALRRSIPHIVVAFLFILVRCIYRLAAAIGGWNSRVNLDELTFAIVEGFTCCIAAGILINVHPAYSFLQLAEDELQYTKTDAATPEQKSIAAVDTLLPSSPVDLEKAQETEAVGDSKVPSSVDVVRVEERRKTLCTR